MTKPFVYPGAIHIHTTYSDGTGSFPEVINAAREAGLRWIIVTDHDNLAGLPYAGWHDGVLVIVGHEITPDRNHFLALNVDSLVSPALAPQQFVNAVYDRGGFGIIAHPDERIQNKFKGIYRWDDWTIDGPQPREGRVVGLELWNVMSDWGEHLNGASNLMYVLNPRLGLSGPSPATMAWWDRLNMVGRRTFGIGGVDAHAFHHQAPWGTLTIFPYRWMFNTLTNYLALSEPLSADAATAINQVYAALVSGCSYFVNRLDGDAPAIRFHARRGADQFGMGDTCDLRAGPLLIEADVGSDAYVRLIADGEVMTSGVQRIRQSIADSGVYRLEAYKGATPWLFTNPLFVTDEPAEGRTN
jgi:hypothetical protein